MDASSWRLFRRTIGWMFVAATMAGLVLIWPQSLGGKTSYVKVDGHSMDPTYHMGDLALVEKQPTYQIGDPVAYIIPKDEFGAGAMVIHRLIGGDGVHGYVTKGDNRNIKDEWHPRDSDIVGRVRFDIPRAGVWLGTLTRPVYVGAFVASLTVIVMLFPSSGGQPGRRRKTELEAAITPDGLVT